MDIYLFGINQKQQNLTKIWIPQSICDLDGIRSAMAGEEQGMSPLEGRGRSGQPPNGLTLRPADVWEPTHCSNSTLTHQVVLSLQGTGTARNTV